MPHSSSQIFLRELDKKLWTATDNLPVHTGGLKEGGRLAHPYKITSTGKLIDDALEAVEKENPKLKNVLNKDHVRLQIQQENLAGLAPAKPSGDAGLIDTIPFQHADLSDTFSARGGDASGTVASLSRLNRDDNFWRALLTTAVI